MGDREYFSQADFATATEEKSTLLHAHCESAIDRWLLDSSGVCMWSLDQGMPTVAANSIQYDQCECGACTEVRLSLTPLCTRPQLPVFGSRCDVHLHTQPLDVVFVL